MLSGIRHGNTARSRSGSVTRFVPVMYATGADQIDRPNAVGRRRTVEIPAMRSGGERARNGLPGGTAHRLQGHAWRLRIEHAVQHVDRHAGLDKKEGSWVMAL